MEQVNNNVISKAGKVPASQATGALVKSPTAGLLALSSIVSSFIPSISINLAQGTTVAAKNLA
jgi:predicted RNA-binding protein with RPS1 domain